MPSKGKRTGYANVLQDPISPECTTHSLLQLASSQ